MNGGFFNQALKFKDYAFEGFFEFPEAPKSFVPLRKIEDADRVPDVYQGNLKGCVPCAVSWIAMYFRPGLIVDWKTLALKCKMDEEGTEPGVVLNKAYDEKLIPNFFILKKKDPETIYKALHVSPLVIGVEGLPMVPEPHFMVLWDVTEDGKNWRCFTWDKENGQGYLEISLDFPIVYAACFFTAPGMKPPTYSLCDVLTDKLSLYAKKLTNLA